VKDILDFIEATEATLDKEFKISLDADKLKQQLLDHNKLESDLR